MIIPQEHLSIILTTSPIKSHPSTVILDGAIKSILSQPSLANIHVYIICDGAKISPHDQNKYKSGIISQQTFQNYKIFRQIIKQKYGSQKQKFTIIQRQFRCGFAQNIKFIMENYAKTDHIFIYQHDYVIQKELPLGQVVQMMRKYQNQINYITFMNLSYTNVIPKMESIPKLRTFLLKLLQKDQNYNFIVNIRQYQRQLAQFFKIKFGLPLVPLNFWYDKLHIASRKFYLDVIFNQQGNYDPNRGKNMKTVTFVEDTFGHCMKWTIDQNPQALLTKYGAFILWDQIPVFYHESGRTFITEEARQQYKIVVQKKPKEEQYVELGDFEQIVQK